ncbi:MAG: Rne/Rng family ribonuclease [Hyphomicrobiaceae bacterium]
MEKNKMLIDATHPEETRVVVLRGGRVEEFDYESASRKPLRGNIYLAKVTRVEPSLQAAFVEYGGNRHGFLAFSEIHPDYYQIPFADRQALIDEEVEEEARAEREADARAERRERRGRGRNRHRLAADAKAEDALAVSGPEAGEDEDVLHDAAEADERGEYVEFETEAAAAEPIDASPPPAAPLAHPREDKLSAEAEIAIETIEVGHAQAHEFPAEPPPADEPAGEDDAPRPIGLVEEIGVTEIDGNGATPEVVEQVGAEDALEELPERPQRRRARQYKIQEVIKRRQIILVQVVKEERGNKGAALTTYLSLAGRYTVLMPNTGRGGGISRKITNAQDRKRLKAIAEELEVPEGMGLIIRTAGAARTKQEIRRDFEYLLRLWESVRDLTLRSTAPCLVYEEGNLIKRSLRDLYSKDIDQVLVAGEEAYEEAHGFLSMLMPGHADSVVLYREPEPLFSRFQIERQLNAMFSPYVTLRSGGYLVINQTEALVAIDVNSGKSTREFSIEETALSTNLEAADEIARQLKLRDLAGLIVVDFIDMEEKRNNRAVERRLKDALRHDRARIQVGHISHFGLLEMSRQRLRTGVLEGSTSQCPHCQGTGIIRSTESIALAVLRGIEDHLMKGPVTSISVLTTASVALYILNHKRGFIAEIEQRYGIFVSIQASERMQGANFAIERTSEPTTSAPRRDERNVVSMDWGFDGSEAEGEAEERTDARESGAGEEDVGEPRSRRRRRRGRGRRDRQEAAGEPQEPRGPEHEVAASADRIEAGDAEAESAQPGEAEELAGEAPVAGRGPEEGDGGGRSRRRRRGRRGGRSRHREGALSPDGRVIAGSPADPSAQQPEVDPSYHPHTGWGGMAVRRRDEVAFEIPDHGVTSQGIAWEIVGAAQEPEPAATEALAPAKRDAEPVTAAPVAPAPAVAEPAPAESTPVHEPSVGNGSMALAETAPKEAAPQEPPAPEGPPRRGWWQRRFGS